MTDSPEIKRLREQASSDGIYPTRWVTLAHAEQAVRDAEARVREEERCTCKDWPKTHWPDEEVTMDNPYRELFDIDTAPGEEVAWDEGRAAGRREAFREAVEALRDQIGSDEQDVADAVAESAADFIESRFIQGDE